MSDENAAFPAPGLRKHGTRPSGAPRPKPEVSPEA